MMIIKYQCEVCGATYNTEEHAKNCEEFHIGVERIYKENRDRTDRLLNRPYPKSIDVVMKDGKVFRYQNPVEVEL